MTIRFAIVCVGCAALGFFFMKSIDLQKQLIDCQFSTVAPPSFDK